MKTKVSQFRLDYVRNELGANGFRSDPAKVFNRLVEELAYAIWSPIHEQRQAAYGVILTNEWERHYSHMTGHFKGHYIKCDDPESAREFIDGETSYLVNDENGFYVWIPEGVTFANEATLFILRDTTLFVNTGLDPHAPPSDFDFVVIKRSKDGSIMLFHWDGVIVIRQGGNWSSKVYEYSLLVEEKIETRVGKLRNHMGQTLRYLTTVCLHRLSADGCGATIIPAFDDDHGLESVISRRNSKTIPYQLQIGARSSQGPIAHALTHHDGVAIFNESGRLLSLGNWLTPPEKALAEHESPGGTRQLTAQVASKYIRSPIFTVSQDGPVRVFHSGELIATTKLDDQGGKSFLSQPSKKIDLIERSHPEAGSDVPG